MLCRGGHFPSGMPGMGFARTQSPRSGERQVLQRGGTLCSPASPQKLPWEPPFGYAQSARLTANARCLGRETLLQHWSHRNALAPLLHSAVLRWAGLPRVAHLSVEPLLDLGLPVFSASGVFPKRDYYATSIGLIPLSER
jgi:hypothetical protein